MLEAIALGRTTVSTKPSRAARAAAALRLPPAVVLGVKDAFASRSRAAMTIASLALTMGTVVMALGTEATYRRVIQDSSLRAKPYELLVDANDVSPARTRALLAAQSDEVAGTATVVGTTASVPGSPVDVWARALGGDYRAGPTRCATGACSRGPGEAIVGRGLLDALHLKRRRPPPARGRGRAAWTCASSGATSSPTTTGGRRSSTAARCRAAALARFGPVQYELQLRHRSDAHAVQAALVRTSAGQLDVEATEDGVRQERSDLRPVLYGTDALLLTIGLVNLLTTLLLGIRERVRDFAIFKVVGLTPRQVLAAVTSGGTLLATVAVVGGIAHRAAGLPRARDGDQPDRRARPRDRPDVVVGRCSCSPARWSSRRWRACCPRGGPRRSSRPRRCVTNEPVRGP